MDTSIKNNRLPVLALRDLVIFPHMVTHFDAGRKKSIDAIEAAELQGGKIFLVAQKDLNVEDPEREDIFNIGTIATIKQILKLPGGIVRVLVEGEARGELGELELDPYLESEIIPIEEEKIDEDSELEALLRMVEEDLSEYSEQNSKMFPGLLESVVDYSNPSAFADTIGAYVHMELEDSQRLLEAFDIKNRLLVLHEIMSKELELLNIENDINEKVKSQMNKVQKDYYLREQIRVIRDELGEGVDETEDYEIYRKKLEEKELPEEVREKAEHELSRLNRVQPAAPEYAEIINYLDWIIDLPWLEGEEENIDIKKARKILNEDHYGLKDVKERILEFIALRKNSENTQGPILCLVGPPGVGKTSVARSVARALEKQYVRMSLGGMTDESEIRGHRRTYVGAMPGRIISLMKDAGENNPLFLLDEIDKVGSDYKGDPASGLLEVLDPAQNDTFTDRYISLPFDLSKVFFITTANTTKTIPAPLLDRMEVIEIGGYTPEEKFEIAKRYLLPRQLKNANLEEGKVTISDNALRTLIDYYTREAGVRILEKEIAKIVRKAVLEMLEQDKDSISVTNRNLTRFVGEKKYTFDLVEEDAKVGEVNGLAWTQVGGETLRIEANVLPGKGSLKLTGNLGDVMKESAQLALSYLMSHAEDYGIAKDILKDHHMHLHVPEGATPKDGPSAGIAMTLAMYSALSGKKVRSDVAMTGEVTLRGRVLPIGGLKEKLLAAYRMGITKVLIPEENRSDLKDIDSPSLKKLKIVPVSNVSQVFEESFEK